MADGLVAVRVPTRPRQIHLPMHPSLSPDGLPNPPSSSRPTRTSPDPLRTQILRISHLGGLGAGPNSGADLLAANTLWPQRCRCRYTSMCRSADPAPGKLSIERLKICLRSRKHEMRKAAALRLWSDGCGEARQL